MENLISTLEWLHSKDPERFSFIQEYIEGAAEMSRAVDRKDSRQLIILDNELSETLKKEHKRLLKRIETSSLAADSMEQAIFILNLLERHFELVLGPKYIK